jgi:hypothetical protein
MQDSSQANADSLVLAREREVASEFGFRDSNTLKDVAVKLEIEDIARWKHALNLEPENKALDNMSLRRLGITPYQAFLAKQTVDYGFNELSSLGTVAAKLDIPIKKMKAMLGYNDSMDTSQDNLSLQALNIELETISGLKEDFDEHILSYSGSVTLVGILIVFSALLITSIIISQLVHLNKKKDEESKITVSSSGKVKSAPKDLNSNVIVAAITALHMHRMDLEERRKMVLTFRRTPTNQWRASAVLSMPNREMTSVRRPK